MSRVSCCVCSRDGDSRSMRVCPECSSYVCDDCYDEHRYECGQ